MPLEFIKRAQSPASTSRSNRFIDCKFEGEKTSDLDLSASDLRFKLD